MADEADAAQRLELAERTESLARMQRRTYEQPRLSIAGQRVCLDCDVPIDPLRLRAIPTAVRCLECETIRERLRRG